MNNFLVTENRGSFNVSKIDEKWTPQDLLNAFKAVETVFSLTDEQYAKLPESTQKLFKKEGEE